MPENVCDKTPCLPLRSAMPGLTTEMLGESNDDLRVVVEVRGYEPPDVRLRITLLYCPFCGVRLDGDLVHAVARERARR